MIATVRFISLGALFGTLAFLWQSPGNTWVIFYVAVGAVFGSAVDHLVTDGANLERACTRRVLYDVPPEQIAESKSRHEAPMQPSSDPRTEFGLPINIDSKQVA